MTEPGPMTLAYLARHPDDAARVMETLDPADLAAFIATVPVRLAAAPIGSIASWRAGRCLAALDGERAAALLDAMPAEAAVACLRAMPAATREAILERIPQRRARALRHQLAYPAALVGAAMDGDAVTLVPGATAAEALAALRSHGGVDVMQIYLADAARRLAGIVPVAALVHAAADRPLHELAWRDVDALSADTPLTQVAADPRWRERPELPVVDGRGRLVGSITLGRVLAARQRGAGTVSAGAGPALQLGQGYLVSVGGLLRIASAMLTGSQWGRHDR